MKTLTFGVLCAVGVFVGYTAGGMQQVSSEDGRTREVHGIVLTGFCERGPAALSEVRPGIRQDVASACADYALGKAVGVTGSITPLTLAQQSPS